ncbi:MAG: tyrosine-type recombinase/integrase [Chloroflexi bacterium]|nr:tyrosine-type recombinase/integrase [Chloroflexota bacterium]
MAKAYLEPEEVGQLEGAADNLRDKLLIRLLFRLGCRISEAIGIGEDNLDFVRGEITIQHLKVRMKLSCPECQTRLAKTAKFCPGCGSRVEKVVSEASEHRRQRVLPVDKNTLSMLREYIDRGGLVEVDGRKLLFGIQRRRATEIVSECAARAGLGYLVNPETGEIRGISPHRLRDAFAVMAVKKDDSGDGLRLLQEQLGHQSIVTTMKYRKVSGEEQKEWYDRIWQKN